MHMKRFVGGVGSLTFLIFYLVLNASHAATPLSRSGGTTSYYQVQESFVYQGQTLIQFGTVRQLAVLTHPVVLMIPIGSKVYRVVYKITDNITTQSGQKGVAVSFGVSQYFRHQWTSIGKPSMELLDGKTGRMAVQRVGRHGRTKAWQIVFQAKPLPRYRVLGLLAKARKPADRLPYRGISANESMSSLLTSATPNVCCRTPCYPGPGSLTCCGAMACCDCNVCCQPP